MPLVAFAVLFVLSRSPPVPSTFSTLTLPYGTPCTLTTELQIERPVLCEAEAEAERRGATTPAVIPIKPFARPGARSCRRRGDRERRCHRGPRGGVLRALRREWRNSLFTQGRGRREREKKRGALVFFPLSALSRSKTNL